MGKVDNVVPKRTDGKKTKIPKCRHPLKKVVSREEVFRQLREDIRRDPALAEGMSRRHKKIIGIK